MPENGTSAATLSPVRLWVRQQLNDLIPTQGGSIRSDTNGALFQQWTGWTQAGLAAQWEAEKGGKAVTTSCNAFLGTLVNKIRTAGGLAIKTFHSFDLPKAGGTAWYWNPTPEKTPQPGDFFQIGTRGGMYKHVGVIVDINYIIWTTVEGGQGGPKSGFDAIKRKVGVMPSGLMGWINIDEFFQGWSG
jgi:hypothetical protein